MDMDDDDTYSVLGDGALPGVRQRGEPVIRETAGDILEADVEALVNPVNTVGVMGAGLALQFRRKYPDMFRQYIEVCRRGKMGIGQVMFYYNGTNPRYIILFPTKRDWRDKSELEWIDQGLVGLREMIETLQIRSTAIPPLGCGLGGLAWADVRGLIVERLGGLDVDVALYGPDTRGEARKQ
jgi:O-acetyl-ADP-ribose deacetylase (regulator of RNase III)